jgi:hypothetical protein
VTALDEQVLRRRLRAELAALPVRPAPVPAVTSRGRAVRARRRRIAAACAALISAAVATLIAVPDALPASLRGGQGVTMNTPDPAAPGGVFASGTAAGRSWRLSLDNIAARTTRACVPAVMLNGQRGDVLTAGLDRATRVGYSGFLTLLPGLDGIGYGFVDVRPSVTKVSVVLADKTAVAAVPVAVTRCGNGYHLAGFAYARAAPTHITVYSGKTRVGTSVTGWVPFQGHYGGPAAYTPTGLWENTPAGSSHAVYSGVAGTGTIGSTVWQVEVSLGASTCHGLATSGPRRGWWTACWAGECYHALAASLGKAHTWQSETCLPVTRAPRLARLTQLPAINVLARKHAAPAPRMTLYAGMVAARTARVVAYLSNGTTRPLTPALVAGRAYIGLAVPEPVRVTKLALLDQASTPFYAVTRLPRSCGLPQVPACRSVSGQLIGRPSAVPATPRR